MTQIAYKLTREYDLYNVADKIENMADVIACAIIRQQRPAEDLISLRQAYEEFGRGWVDKHFGKLKVKVSGSAKNSPKKVSRTELKAILQAERDFKAAVLPRRERKTKSQTNKSN